MENVPRVAKILEQELRPDGHLAKFGHLNIVPRILNMERFGLPQRRNRCIAGNFDFDLLDQYTTRSSRKTLGSVIRALAQNPICDPIYGICLDRSELRDHVAEEALNEEEVRINKAAKMTHPVYNTMSFPDPLNRSVRTITATCTRVARESIVIENPARPHTFRRLTVRERASLQGFPVTFQFYGKSYGQKLRMVGNAVPPLFSYYVAQALLGRAPEQVKEPTEYADFLKSPVPPAIDALPERPGSRYPYNRTFRFAIPSLRLMSGVRFELANAPYADSTTWEIAFYFGTSKSIQSLPLDNSLHDRLFQGLPDELSDKLDVELCRLGDFIRRADVANMQRLWSHRGLGLTRPFMLLDQLDESGARVTSILTGHELLAQTLVGRAIWARYGEEALTLPGLNKLARNAVQILSGLLVGARANASLLTHFQVRSNPILEVAAG
jgi:DNA (cytosine-5)-methyltransferase 1